MSRRSGRAFAAWSGCAHTARFAVFGPARASHRIKPTVQGVGKRLRSRYLRDPDIVQAGLVTALVFVLSGGLVWLGYLWHVCRIARRSPLQPPQRMIVLVFGRRLEHGLPDVDYEARLSRTLSLARQQLTDRVLLLGGARGDGPSEAAAGQRWLLDHALPASVQVQLEQDSADSLENLKHARMLLRAADPHGALPPVALVSSRYHLARCRLLARRLGLDVTPIAAEPHFPRRPALWALLLLESGYVMLTDLGLRWAHLIGNRRMSERIS